MAFEHLEYVSSKGYQYAFIMEILRLSALFVNGVITQQSELWSPPVLVVVYILQAYNIYVVCFDLVEKISASDVPVFCVGIV